MLALCVMLQLKCVWATSDKKQTNKFLVLVT